MAAPSRSDQVLHALQARLALRLGTALEAGSRQWQADGKLGPEVQVQLLELLKQMSHALLGHVQAFAAMNVGELASREQQIERACREAGLPSTSSQPDGDTTSKSVLVSQRVLVAADLRQAQAENQKLHVQLQELLEGDAKLADAWKAMKDGTG